MEQSIMRRLAALRSSTPGSTLACSLLASSPCVEKSALQTLASTASALSSVEACLMTSSTTLLSRSVPVFSAATPTVTLFLLSSSGGTALQNSLEKGHCSLGCFRYSGPSCHSEPGAISWLVA